MWMYDKLMLDLRSRKVKVEQKEEENSSEGIKVDGI